MRTANASQVLRQLIEPGQYTSIRYSERLLDAGALASIGTVGEATTMPRPRA